MCQDIFWLPNRNMGGQGPLDPRFLYLCTTNISVSILAVDDPHWQLAGLILSQATDVRSPAKATLAHYHRNRRKMFKATWSWAHLTHEKYWQGSKWVLSKKSEKRVTSSYRGCMHILKRSLKSNIFLQGGLGVLPQNIFDFRGRKLCILVPLWVILLQYPHPYIPESFFSPDLHWSQEWSWELEKGLKSD